MSGIAGFLASAVGDGAALSPREVRTRVLNWWFGVSMTER